jgi:hypothetical protein
MLFSIVITLVLLGLALYLIQLIPLAAPFPQLIRVVVIIAAVLYLLSAFGLFGAGNVGLGVHNSLRCP